MQRNRLLTLLVLLMTAATGAWADDPVLLVTIDASSDFVSGSKTFDNKVTATFSGTVGCPSGWYYGTSGDVSLTVTGAAGCTVTSCTFYGNEDSRTIDGNSPMVYFNEGGVYTGANTGGDELGSFLACIEVYGYPAPPVDVTGVTLPATATVTLGDAVALTAAVAPADATDKKVKWTVTAGTDKVKLYTDAECKTEVGTDATDVLTVYAKGLAAGEATVEAVSNADATMKATCAVTAKHGTYKVAMKAGVTDGDQWTARAGGSGAFAAMPLKGVEGGTKPVELKYAGDREVKRVTMRVVPTWKGDLSKLSATELEDDGVTVLVKNGMTLTGTLDGTTQKYKITIAAGATVTLDGATINGVHSTNNYKWAGLNCLGDATIVLKDGTTNTVKGFNAGYPGIHVPEGSTLTITGGPEGTGKLTASPYSTSDSFGAGIGGGYEISCGHISIEGGDITATGGDYAAGIGSGLNSSCGSITITDGVTKVTATKGGSTPYSIGAGRQGSCGTVTIGGTVYWQDGQAVNDGDTYLAQATIVYPQTVVNLSTLTADTELKDGDVVTGTLDGASQKYKITIAAGATVTLNNATINGWHDNPDDESATTVDWAGLNCLGDATIILKDDTENSVKGFFSGQSGIHVANGSTLTIMGESKGNGKLTASSNGWGAGIGGRGCGNIIIESGDITAIGGGSSAGIGAGGANPYWGANVPVNCSDITIRGGIVKATGGNYGAGIGGAVGVCGAITITGGTVTATGGYRSAAIGSGANSGCGSITITDGVTRVTATKGNQSAHSIGKGYGAASCGTVTIGGTVYWGSGAVSDGGNYLAQATIEYVNLSKLTANYEANNGTTLFGTLDGSSQPYKITIAAGATVTLDNAVINGASGVGCHCAGLNCLGNATIVLKDGSVNTVKGFHSDYPGIHVPAGYTLTITGGTAGTGKLTASSNGGAAGIGGGSAYEDVNCGNITITGGDITATGGTYAAGIGGGYQATCGNITITNGVKKVQATKGPEAPYSIGAGGEGGSCGTITIGGTVYWENNAAKNGGDTYLAKSPLVYPSLKTLTVNGQTIYYAEGETWSQAIQNHPTENAGWSINADGEVLYGDEWLMVGDNFVSGDTTINPSTPYDLD